MTLRNKIFGIKTFRNIDLHTPTTSCRQNTNFLHVSSFFLLFLTCSIFPQLFFLTLFSHFGHTGGRLATPWLFRLQFLRLFACLFVCLLACWCVCLLVCLFVCLFLFLHCYSAQAHYIFSLWFGKKSCTFRISRFLRAATGSTTYRRLNARRS